MIANSFRWEANAFIGFVERQRNLYRRYWAWEAVWLLYSLVTVLSIGYLASGLSTLGLEPSGVSLRDAQLFLLIGALLWTYLSMVFFEIAFAVTWERWEGTIEYTFMAPVRRITHLLGICAFSLAYGIARAAMIGLVVVPLFKLDLSHANWLSALLIFAAATLPLLGLGTFTAILPLLSPEKAEQVLYRKRLQFFRIERSTWPACYRRSPIRCPRFAMPCCTAHRRATCFRAQPSCSPWAWFWCRRRYGASTEPRPGRSASASSSAAVEGASLQSTHVEPDRPRRDRRA